MMAFVARHAVPIYFALAFTISWAGVLLVVWPDGIPASPERFTALLPVAIAVMLVGPSASGIVMTALAHGRAGLREFRARLLRWRVGARWHAVALFTAPIATTAVLAALSLVSRDFLPGIVVADDRMTMLVFGILVGLAAGTLEELGWTGFATPTLLQRHGPIATGLVVGTLWAAWHLLAGFWGSGTAAGGVDWPRFAASLTSGFGVLVAYRVLMVWVYDRTRSLLVGMMMHASLTATLLVLDPRVAGVGEAVAWNLALTGALWSVVAVLARGRRAAPRSRDRQLLLTSAHAHPRSSPG